MNKLWILAAVCTGLGLVACGREADEAQQTAGPATGQVFTVATLADLRAAGGATLQAAVTDIQAECGDAELGIEPGGITSADLNGDGQRDYLVDMTAITCGGENRGGGWCGSLGCSFDIVVSTGEDYRVDSYIGSEPRIERQETGLGVEAGGRDGPFVAVWNGSEMAVMQAPGEAASAGADAAQVRAVVAAIYDTYLDAAPPGAAPSAETETAELRQAVEAALDAGTGTLRADYYCGCQDYGSVSYAISALRVEGPAAMASVDFTSRGQPARRFDLILRKVGDRWQVDDVREGGISLRETLAVSSHAP